LSLLLPALLFRLGDHPVSKIQEVRIAETAREMLVSGDLLVPHYNGELRLQKPPLPYWATLASYKIAGFNATAVRLPGVLFGLLTALLLFGWSRRELSLQVAANTALVLTVSFIGIRYFRSGEADAMLLFFVSAACMLGYGLFYHPADSIRRLLFGLVLGLGFLTKGPAALAIPILTLLLLATLEKQPARFKACFSLPGLALLILVGFSWYAWMFWQLPDAAQQFFGHQLDETFVSGTHAKPLWWYLAHLFEFFAPWGILLIPALWWSYRQYKLSGSLPVSLRFAWSWLFVVFVLLTITINKQTQYALLLAPPVAMIAGHYLAMAEGGFAKLNKVLFGILCLVALAGAGYAIMHVAPAVLKSFAWLGLLLLPLALKHFLRIQTPSWAVLLVAIVTCMTYLYSEFIPDESGGNPVQILMSKTVAHAPLYQSRPGDGAISFYAGRVVPPISDQDIAALLQTNREIWFVSQQQPMAKDIKVELVAESGELKLFKLKRPASCGAQKFLNNI